MANPANRPYRSRSVPGGGTAADPPTAPQRRAPDEPEAVVPPTRTPPARQDGGLRRRTGSDPDLRGYGEQSRRSVGRTGLPSRGTDPLGRAGTTRTGSPPRDADPPGRARSIRTGLPPRGTDPVGLRGTTTRPGQPSRSDPAGRAGTTRTRRPDVDLARVDRLGREAGPAGQRDGVPGALLDRPGRPGDWRRPGAGTAAGSRAGGSNALRLARLEAHQRRARTARMYRRRRRSVLLAILLLASVAASITLSRRDRDEGESRRPTGAPPAAVPVATGAGPVARPTPPRDARQPAPQVTRARQPAPAPRAGAIPDPREPVGVRAPTAVAYPTAGPATFSYARDAGPVLGSAGTLHRFAVAVEDGMGQNPAGFADTLDRVLGDPRSWVASGRLRLQRTPPSARAAFTIYLATPGTSERLCARGGLSTEGFTSCRLPGQVVINVARWLTAIPDYGAPLTVYQAYAVNHEVGHQLGHGHESCPAPGRPAPVMQQQTYGLKGCLANPWPYLGGVRYAGRSVR